MMGLPSRVREKYQSYFPSCPYFRRNSPPWMAQSSHSLRFSTLLQSIEKSHTSRPWSQMNLSVSYTLPSRSRQEKYPP